MCICQFSPKYFMSLFTCSQKLTNHKFCPRNCIWMVIWSQKCAYISLLENILSHWLLGPKSWQTWHFVLEIISGWLFGPKNVQKSFLVVISSSQWLFGPKMVVYKFTCKYFISLLTWSEKLTNMKFFPENCISMTYDHVEMVFPE